MSLCCSLATSESWRGEREREREGPVFVLCTYYVEFNNLPTWMRGIKRTNYFIRNTGRFENWKLNSYTGENCTKYIEGYTLYTVLSTPTFTIRSLTTAKLSQGCHVPDHLSVLGVVEVSTALVSVDDPVCSLVQNPVHLPVDDAVEGHEVGLVCGSYSITFESLIEVSELSRSDRSVVWNPETN